MLDYTSLLLVVVVVVVMFCMVSSLKLSTGTYSILYHSVSDTN